MADTMAERFIRALEKLESSGDLDPLVSLFSDECRVRNVVLTETMHGQEGARRFWAHYRATFRDLRSTFRNVVEAGSRIALEWETTGTLASGEPVVYDGASVLEVEDDRIVRFTAYFDPSEVARSPETHMP